MNQSSEAQFFEVDIRGFLIDKHLTQGDFALLNSPPPPPREIVNFTAPILQSPWLAQGPTLGESRWHVHYNYEQYLHGEPLVIQKFL